jgi:hypothetical protein
MAFKNRKDPIEGLSGTLRRAALAALFVLLEVLTTFIASLGWPLLRLGRVVALLFGLLSRSLPGLLTAPTASFALFLVGII